VTLAKPSGSTAAPPPPAPAPGRGARPEQPTPPVDGSFEYSSREVKPTAVLLQDLLRAHSVFLLHHASSLSALFVRTQRDKFVSLLSRYWDLFLSTWNVLLHGNPACSVLGGIKIAACGELGIGVGEEERGSGERDVLEGLVGGIEGLVDMVVGKFPGPAPKGLDEDGTGRERWLGTGNEPGAEDGAIFLGVGALSRHSLRAITFWMEDMYTWGENAYGVVDRPTSTRSQKRRKQPLRKTAHIPPPIVRQSHAGNRPRTENSRSRKKDDQGTPASEGTPKTAEDNEASGAGMDKILSYLKLGYGTSWSLSGSSPTDHLSDSQDGLEDTANTITSSPSSGGRFLIGLLGDVERGGGGSEQDDPSSQDQGDVQNPNSRNIVRTISVELEAETRSRSESCVTKDLGSHDTELAEQEVDADGHVTAAGNTSFDSQDRNKTKKLRVVVYVNHPFIFVFLFRPRTDSLEFEGLYRSLHTRLTPIHKSLIQSTAYRPERPDTGLGASAEIYDLVWDPQSLTVHSTVPNIPEPLLVANTTGASPVWSRVEALNTHNQILNMFMATRENLSEFERTCKTSRGWWVVWNRILEHGTGRDRRSSDSTGPDSVEDDEGEEDHSAATLQDFVVSKEIFLIRRASDHTMGSARSISSSYMSGGSGGGWADGASRLAQGIGVDTRRYIEGLLSLNR